MQAVSEHLYTALLPGLTNVTDRARCYGFYPWFVWAFDHRARRKNAEELIRVFRRAECLHTLIGIVHELDANDRWPHGDGLVGRDVLVGVANRLVDGETIRLSAYSKLEPADDKRYFQHKLGGLGQYYLGPLKDLEVLDGSAKDGLRYTTSWGAELATTYDAGVDADAFFEAVSADLVDVKTVRGLSAFCPCHLRTNKGERNLLVKLLFCHGEGRLKVPQGTERRQTLVLLLEHSRALKRIKDHHPDPSEFLNSCYTGVLPDSTTWSVPTALGGIRTGWEIYRRHELLAIAVQGLFWAGLSALLDEGGYVQDAATYAEWFSRRFRGVLGERLALTTFRELVDGTSRSLPPHADRQSPDHEVNLADDLLVGQHEGDLDRVVAQSIRVLLALAARGIHEAPYGTLVVADRFFQTYEINLWTLRALVGEDWQALSAPEWLEWLAANWALRVHFRVALRKLRYQSQDSFRIVPHEDGLRVREAPPAQWSSPRLGQALRFLWDIGALELQEEFDGRPYALSVFGERLLESELGRA